METAAIILDFVRAWLWAGAAVAPPFLLWGVDRVEPNARGAYVFRPLLVPAVLLIWPLVLWRWFVLETGRDDWAKRHRPPRRAHRYAALLFAATIPLVILTGLAVKQTGVDAAPVRLEGPGE